MSWALHLQESKTFYTWAIQHDHGQAVNKKRKKTLSAIRSSTSLVCVDLDGHDRWHRKQLSLELGFAVGSFFAVGGIGSATVILALRSIFENLVGGLLLKVQDRFRQGEKISIGNNKEDGWVEEIGIVNTIIRRVDNSRVAVPNNDFVTDLVVNWSRTPFRIFNAHVFIPSEDADALQPIVQAIRRRVATVEGIASPDDRPLLVFASEFKRNEWHVDGKWICLYKWTSPVHGHT